MQGSTHGESNFHRSGPMPIDGAALRAVRGTVGVDDATPVVERKEIVLVLTPMGKDSVNAQAVLAKAGIWAEHCQDLKKLCTAFNDETGVLLIAEEALTHEVTPELIDHLNAQPAWSDIPIVILTSGGETSQTSVRVIRLFQNSGNVTLLERPIRALTLVSSIQVALRARRRQWEIRDLIAKGEALAEDSRLARVEAENANRMKDEFLATLSHELRTPLNAILGWTQLMLSEGLDEDETRVAIETVDRNARTQAQLIEDLLDISRITSGKLRLDMLDVEINDVIAAAVASVRPAAESKGVTVSFSRCDTCAVHADPARLQQIVWNLLSNAVKFTPSGGTVDVTASTSEGRVLVRVADKGAGIDPAFLPFVFDRFRQADGSTTRRQGGLGLGLSIVKQLVELHGGTVSVESSGLGQGATFTVTFPILADQTDIRFRKPSRESDQGLLDLSGVHILVVDDEPDSREVLRRALLDRKANVRVAASVNEALAAIDGAKPDLILSDISMPERDGYDLIHELRTNGHAAERIPAIAITAFARPDDRDKILRAGFQGHLAKPIDLSSLSRVMKDVLTGPSPKDHE